MTETNTCWFYRDKLNEFKPQVWATIVPSRTTKPVVALHKSLAHAKNAVSASSPPRSAGFSHDSARGGYPVAEAEVHELVDGEWVLRWTVDQGTYPNELPWKVAK